jgi:DNA-binding MarR family transcriptional regulator
MPATTPVFSAELLGRAEKTLNAILGQLLAGSGVTEPQWVALTLAVSSGGDINRDVYLGKVAGALRVSDTRASAQIAELAAARLLDLPASDGAPITVTESGQQLYRRVRAATGEVTQRMWGDLPAADLEAAGRVLRTVLSRADAYLASTSSDHGPTTTRS